MKATLSFKVEFEVKIEIDKESQEKGYKNVSAYLSDIIAGRNENKLPSDMAITIADQDLEISQLKKQLEDATKDKPNQENLLAAHYAKRAYEIGRISIEKLNQGF